MSRKRLRAATSVVEQARVRASTSHKNVEPLTYNEQFCSSGIRARVDETPEPITGTPRLRIVIPGKKGVEFYDLSPFLVQPELASFVAEGFRSWAVTVGAKSRMDGCSCLLRGFGSFLATLSQQIPITAIDEEFWANFIAWMNGPRNKEGAAWAPSTRASLLGALKRCVDALLDHPKYGRVAVALKDRSGLPTNPWRNRSRKTVPTAVMSPHERQAMILAALKEVGKTHTRLNERDEIIQSGRDLLKNTQFKRELPPYRESIGACAVQLAEAFPDRMASINDLRAYDRALGNAVHNTHGMLPVRQLLYSTFRDLVPFVLLLSVKTAFNPDSILSMTWSRVRVSADGQTITFLGVKNRASGLQISVNSDATIGESQFPAEPGIWLGLAEILNILRKLTERTRPILHNQDHADHLFIGAPSGSGSKAKAFEHKKGPSSDIAWKFSLQKFIDDNRLPPFTLKMLRFSEGEAEWRRTGDLLAVRDRLNHTSVKTTRNHYTSGGMLRESQLRVAETQVFYHRWARSEGRIDPRNQVEECRSAATPGFGCLNPFDSPRPGQRKGKICTAYGECSDCPLAQTWPWDVQASAYYLALPAAILEARLGRISAKHWAQKWSPILIAHNRLLEEIPPEVRLDAANFQIKLKPVG